MADPAEGTRHAAADAGAGAADHGGDREQAGPDLARAAEVGDHQVEQPRKGGQGDQDDRPEPPQDRGAHQPRRPHRGGAGLHPGTHLRGQAHVRVAGEHRVPDRSLHAQGGDDNARVRRARAGRPQPRRVDVHPVGPVADRLGDDRRCRRREGGTRAVEPALHGGDLTALEHPDEGIDVIGPGQPAQVAERQAELVGVELLLLVREPVEDAQVQRVHLGVEAGLVEGLRASRLPLGGLGLYARVRDVPVRLEQVMQVRDQELQQARLVEVGDKGQLRRLAESGLPDVEHFPAAVVEQLRHQPAQREDRPRGGRWGQGDRRVRPGRRARRLAAFRRCGHKRFSTLARRIALAVSPDP